MSTIDVPKHAAALDLLQNTAVKASGLQVVRPPAEPDDVYYLNSQSISGEGYVRRIAEPGPRRYCPADLTAFAAAVDYFTPDEVNGVNRCVIFCGQARVVALFDEAGARRDRLLFALTTSDQFDRLCAWAAARKQYDHRGFVECLRTELTGAVPPDFLLAIRNLKFAAAGEKVSNLAPGKETLGQKVQREVCADGKAIPEEVTFDVFVYEDLTDEAVVQTIRCALIVDLEQGQFTIVPMAGEIATAQRNTDQHIAASLRELCTKPVTVFCGHVGG